MRQPCEGLFRRTTVDHPAGVIREGRRVDDKSGEAIPYCIVPAQRHAHTLGHIEASGARARALARDVTLTRRPPLLVSVRLSRTRYSELDGRATRVVWNRGQLGVTG
jgi:hypothetical protein